MNPFCVVRGAGAACALVVGSSLWSAESAASRSSTSAGTARPAASATKGGSARGVLPDPVLLDGSAHPAEKKSEFGMVGDFELPGDENVRNGRVGGPPNQQQNQGSGGGMPPGLPQGGGGGQQAAQQGAPPPKAGGGGAAPGQENPNAAGQQIAGAGDPNAKAEGRQVAQLGGEGAAGQEQGGAQGQRPPPVAIGDSAMRIQTQAGSPAVVGSQQASANTQHHEKGTGTGGKGPTAPGGPNRVEKGRAIPAGL